MGLDIRTKKGRLRERCQYYVADKLAEKLQLTFVHCGHASVVDGFLCDRDGNILYVVEIKCRTEDRRQFQKWGSFMISERKYDDIALIAEKLKVRVIIAVGMGFVEDTAMCENIAYFDISHPSALKSHLDKDTKITAASVNGGKIMDETIFLKYGAMIFIM